MSTSGPLLEVEALSVDYLSDAGRVRAVDGVSFQIGAGEIFGLCGESGSGKSTLALALPRLLSPPAVITGGQVRLGGLDLLRMSDDELHAVRGRHIGLVPQSGMNALNPLLPVAAQIEDALAVDGPARGGRAATAARVQELLAQVGLVPAIARAFAHELSGGMRQRAVLAVALARRPRLLVLDEATGALDVLVQQQLCVRLRGLVAELGLSLLFVSHDLPLTLGLCDRVGVLYAGRLVELAGSAELRAQPRHPYSAALLGCFLDPRQAPDHAARMGIPGTPPDPRALPSGCAFHPRCASVFEPCARERPALFAGPGGRLSACHLERGR